MNGYHITELDKLALAEDMVIHLMHFGHSWSPAWQCSIKKEKGGTKIEITADGATMQEAASLAMVKWFGITEQGKIEDFSGKLIEGGVGSSAVLNLDDEIPF